MIYAKCVKIIVVVVLFGLSNIPNAQASVIGQNDEINQKLSDSEKLSRALDYFQSGKYHEALIWFQKLDNEYKLNPRFRAYIGVCYFYDGEYEKVVKTIEPLFAKLKAFAPHELAVYYYCVAESYFNLKKYVDAVPLYETHTLICYNNEKGDSLYRIGLCYKYLGDIPNAQEYLVEAMTYFRRFNDSEKLLKVNNELERIMRN